RSLATEPLFERVEVICFDDVAARTGIVDVVIAVEDRVPLVAQEGRELTVDVVLLHDPLHVLPVRGQSLEALLVKVDDATVAFMVAGHIVPGGVTGDGSEVEVSASSGERSLDAAVA